MKRIIVFLFFLVWFSGVGFGDIKNYKGEKSEKANIDKNNTLNSDIFIKGKVYIHNGISNNAKIVLAPTKVWNESVFRSDLESHYIKSIVANIGERKVLDVYFGVFKFAFACVVRFDFRDFPPYYKNIIYIVTDNLGNDAKKSFSIKRKGSIGKHSIISTQSDDENLTINPKVWSTTTIDETINILYGKTLFRKLKKNPNTKITHLDVSKDSLCSKEKCIHYRHSTMQLTLKSKKELHSIAFFYTGYKHPLLAFFNIPSVAIPYASFKLHIPMSGEIMVVAKGKDGNLYQSKSLFIDTEVIKSADSNDGAGIIFTLE